MGMHNYYLFTTDTTDVQDAHLIVDRGRNSLEVNCSFMANSSALGCVFELNGELTYISIEEARYCFSAQGPLGNFTFSVYDWEHDGSVGRQPVPVRVHETTLNPTTSPACRLFGVPTGGMLCVRVVAGRGKDREGMDTRYRICTASSNYMCTLCRGRSRNFKRGGGGGGGSSAINSP